MNYHFFLQRFPALHGFQMSIGLSEHPAQDLALSKHGETFIQPKMFEGGIGDQITSPTVRDLVGNGAR